MAKVVIRDEYYSCFQGNGSRVNYITFDNLLEGWKKYTEMKSKEFNYGDAWYEVDIRLCIPVREDKPQRPHARSQWEWEDIIARQEYDENRMFDETEIAYLMSLSFDEDIMI